MIRWRAKKKKVQFLFLRNKLALNRTYPSFTNNILHDDYFFSYFITSHAHTCRFLLYSLQCSSFIFFVPFFHFLLTYFSFLFLFFFFFIYYFSLWGDERNTDGYIRIYIQYMHISYGGLTSSRKWQQFPLCHT